MPDLDAQLRRAVGLCVQAGLYDAADWIRSQVTWPSDVPAAVRDEAAALLASDRKIQAIAYVRAETGMSLADAKSWVEALEQP